MHSDDETLTACLVRLLSCVCVCVYVPVQEIERRVHQERVRGDKLQAQLDEAMDKLRTQGGQQEQRSKRKRASPSPEEQQMVRAESLC